MARMLSFPVSFLLSKILNLKTSLTVVQNNDDKKFVIQNLRVLKENVRLIKGAGVDTKKFKRQSEKKGQIVVALPARLLVDKGVYEFVELAKNINASGRKATFRLIEILIAKTLIRSQERILIIGFLVRLLNGLV